MQPLHRGLCLIVGPPYFTAFSLLRLQFHRGLKAIDIYPQRPIEFRQLSVGKFSSEAVIADHLADNLPIFLLHIALIVTLARASASKSDVFLLTVGRQLHVNELSSIIRIDTQQRKG